MSDASYTHQTAGFNFIIIAIGVLISMVYLPAISAGEATAVMLVGVGVANIAIYGMIAERRHGGYDDSRRGGE